MKKYAYLAAAAAAVMAVPASAATNISFESPSLGTGSGAYAYYTNPYSFFVPSGFTAPAGVTFTGASGIQANGSAWGFNNTTDGTQTAFIQSYDGIGGAIDIALSGLTTATNYTVNFLAAQRPGYLANPFTVSVDGTTQAFTATNAAFTPYAATFVATGSTATLSFTGSALPGDGGVGIDAISVTAVPEPATWAMMIGGFGLVGGAMRRRPAKRAAIV